MEGLDKRRILVVFALAGSRAAKAPIRNLKANHPDDRAPHNSLCPRSLRVVEKKVRATR